MIQRFVSRLPSICLGPWSNFPSTSSDMSSVTFDWVQADGLAAGWSTTASPNDLKVAAQLLSTVDVTTLFGGVIVVGFSLAGDIDCSFSVDAPLVVGDGGVNVWFMDTVNFNGYGLFVGNATHIQRVAAFANNGNLTNNARASNRSEVRFTREVATGQMWVYIDGAVHGGALDNTFGTGSLVAIFMSSLTSPTTETTMGPLYISDTIGSGPIPTVRGRPQPTWRGALGLR